MNRFGKTTAILIVALVVIIFIAFFSLDLSGSSVFKQSSQPTTQPTSSPTSVSAENCVPPCEPCVEVCVMEGGTPRGGTVTYTCMPSGKVKCPNGICASNYEVCECPYPCDPCIAVCYGGQCRLRGEVGYMARKYCPDGTCRPESDSCSPCNPSCNECTERCRDGVCETRFGGWIICPPGTANAGSCVNDPGRCNTGCVPPCDGCVNQCCESEGGNYCGCCYDHCGYFLGMERCADGRCIPEEDSCF
ncbi:MAG: hypothetical protein ABIB47_06035 [Candidatus Woesearchaeota archaeon]